MPKTLAIIQARMSSSRLPGKVLLDIGGQPMLARVVERARQAQSLDGIVVATTTDPSDDSVERLCTERGYAVYRGSLQDVLDRYYQAARTFGAQVVVRITGDCPIIDPGVIDATVQIYFRETASDGQAERSFAATRLPPPWRRTLPIGLDVEVVSFASLARAWQEATQPFHREHVMPFFYEGVPFNIFPTHRQEPSSAWSVAHGVSLRGFHVAVLHHDPDYGDLRWTVDTADDLRLLRTIFAHFAERGGVGTGHPADADHPIDHSTDFTWQEILTFVQRQPNLGTMNANVRHKDFRESEVETQNSVEMQNSIETQNIASLPSEDRHA
jgi:spore coat polysaccharide biosynthesis protein SpsF